MLLYTRAQLRYIQLATTRSKPSQAEEMQLLAPTSEQISAIQQFREKNRASTYFNHLSAISESIPALGWVAVAPTPAPYVKEMNDAGQFYTNRVLKEWKEKNKTHVEWCRAWVQLLSDLQAYVKQYHTTGLVWSGELLHYIPFLVFIAYGIGSKPTLINYYAKGNTRCRHDE